MTLELKKCWCLFIRTCDLNIIYLFRFFERYITHSEYVVFVDGAGTTVAFYSNRMRICVECRHIFSTLALLKGLCLYLCMIMQWWSYIVLPNLLVIWDKTKHYLVRLGGGSLLVGFRVPSTHLKRYKDIYFVSNRYWATSLVEPTWQPVLISMLYE